MLIQFSLNADELMRACQHLGMELTDGDELIDFNVVARSVEITVHGAAAELEARTQAEGRVSVPSAVLHGVVRMLPYYGRRKIVLAFSEGKMQVQTTIFHNRFILLSPSGRSRRLASAQCNELSSIVA